MEGTGWILLMWSSSSTQAAEPLAGIVKAAITQMPGLQKQTETDPLFDLL